MNEAELLKAVLDHAKFLGWRVAHFDPGRGRDGRPFTPQRGHVGFPDLILLRPPRLVVAELKSEKGRVDFAQATWLNGFETVAGVEQYVWRPDDWPDGVDAVLR